ncbi:MAG TPA: Flp family type IVb pilin [Thiopseudomonas sp.]|nr:Flp family type IVb pilin [Thiopseudomonas sp.]
MKNLILTAYCKSQAALSNFAKREDGATAIEYALIAGLIAVVIMGAVATLGTDVKGVFEKISDKLGGTGG